MFIYLDEAGNTGGVITVKRRKSGTSGKLNYTDQPLFVEAAVVVNEEDDKQLLLRKYSEFKRQFPDLLVNGELKGSSLCTRKNNRALEIFIKTLLDDKHYYINVYDKKFYLTTLILQEILQIDKSLFLPRFYEMAQALCEEDNAFFVEYCKTVEKPTINNVQHYFNFLISYNYENVFNKGLAQFVEKMNSHEDWEQFRHSLLSKEAYAHHNVSNLINLNCLAELLGFIKDKCNKRNCELSIEHDKIDGIQDVLTAELAEVGLSVSFCDSKNEELIQLADNVASVLFHFMSKVMSHLCSGTLWQGSSKWDTLIYSSLMNIIDRDRNHIKLTLNLNDEAVYRALSDMYQDRNDVETLTGIGAQLVLEELTNIYTFTELQNLAGHHLSTAEVLNKLRE